MSNDLSRRGLFGALSASWLALCGQPPAAASPTKPRPTGVKVIMTVTDSLGQVTISTYDRDGKLISVRRSSGA
jgi:uncharacterized lipoprotein YajG